MISNNNSFLGIFIVIIALVTLFIVVKYNSLIAKKNLVNEGWGGIDIYLKKRFDLIPNLVNTVKGYTSHEANTLVELTKMRSQVSSISDKIVDAQKIDKAIANIKVVAENYPELKASDNFKNLQEQLNQVESDLVMARRYYNGTVRQYNTAIQQFPNNLIASLFNFKVAEFYNAIESEKETPIVKF